MPERDIIDALSEMERIAAIEQVTDMINIGEYGISETPAFLINESVLSVGIVASQNETKKWNGETTEGVPKDLPESKTE